jgi:hypothetical protein
MPSRSNLSILCFELATFTTTWGICFSLEANPNRHNPALFGTFLAQRLRGEHLLEEQRHSHCGQELSHV